MDTSNRIEIRRSGKRKRCAGFSLLELTIAMTLGTVLLSSLFILYYGATSSAAKEEKRGETHKQSRLVTARFAKELRLIGLMALQDVNGDTNDIRRDVPGQPWSDSLRNDVEYANTYELVYTSDVDDDGRTETVRYFLDDQVLKVKTWRWSRDSVRWLTPKIRTLASNVDFLMFRYYDRDGNSIPSIVTYPSGGYSLTTGERIRVTGVEVTLVLKSEHQVNGHRTYMHMPDGTYWYDKYMRTESQFLIRGRNLRLDS